MTDEASTTTWETLVEQYRERAKRDDARIEELMQRAASTTTWETLVEQYRERAKRDDARIEELMQRANHWHDTADMLKRQRDIAEEERDLWKVRARDGVQERHALRVERDALKKYAARLSDAINTFLSFQNSTREPEGQAVLEAALAVQP